jgi:hypothetical protein
LKASIKDVFEDPKTDEDFIRDFLGAVRENWREADKSSTRTLGLMLALFAGFLLISVEAIGEVTLLFVKVTDFSLVRVAIPVLFAYLYVSLLATLNVMVYLWKVHDGLFEYLRPKAYRAHLQRALHPALSAFSGANVLSNATDSRRLGNAIGNGGVARFYIYVLLPLAFEVYAVWQVLAHPQERFIQAVIASILSIVLVLSSIPNIVLVKEQMGDL